MKTYRFSQHLGRTALVLTTAIALSLPVNASVIDGQLGQSTETRRATNVSVSMQMDRRYRLDGVALSLVSRPARSTSGTRWRSRTSGASRLPS